MEYYHVKWCYQLNSIIRISVAKNIKEERRTLPELLTHTPPTRDSPSPHVMTTSTISVEAYPSTTSVNCAYL
jgi:hypothetical protein